jgi:hypothetical protein
LIRGHLLRRRIRVKEMMKMIFSLLLKKLILRGEDLKIEIANVSFNDREYKY